MYYKIVQDNYILSIGIGSGIGEAIEEIEYLNILSVINSRPESVEGIDYKLNTDLQWESFEVPIQEKQISPENALNIILGGETT